MKLLKRIVCGIIILFWVYFGVCYADVLAHNLDTEPDYSGHEWNIFVMMDQHQYDSAQK